MKEEQVNDVQKDDVQGWSSTRREFISQVAYAGAGITLAPVLMGSSETVANHAHYPISQLMSVNLSVNGKKQNLQIDPRVTLLEALREKLLLTGTKKGCDRGQCGACTVLVNGRRVNSCLTLAGLCQNAKVVTVEGLAEGDKLHPMQAAFIKYDAFQCGYCTPGQICSAVGLINEGHAKTDEDIREEMSGNICRCGAYQNIVEAIRSVRDHK